MHRRAWTCRQGERAALSLQTTASENKRCYVPRISASSHRFEMKNNLIRQHEAEFTIFRTSLSHLNLPIDLVDDLIGRHIAVAFEKGELALGDGNTDGMLACILS